MISLVTGGGGFLGRYLVELLVARGHRVRSLARGRYDFLDALGVEQHQGDLRDAVAVFAAAKGVDVVFHTAAIASIFGKWQTFYGTNYLGTLNVLEACLHHHVGKLIYTSSPSVTFDGSDQRGIDESVPYSKRFLAYYPQTKALAEQTVLAANGVGGVATCAIRPHLIWGPRDQHLIPRLLERARQNKLLRVGAGTNLVDMTYVENAAEAHLQAAEALGPGSPVGGRAYFLSQGEPVNCWAWIDEILALANLPQVKRSISARTAYAVGAVFETAWRVLGRTDEPRMTRFLAAQLATDHYFDISAAQRDFGYVPRIPTDEGMRRLGMWLTDSNPQSR